MFRNEVFVSEVDKDRVVKLISEANSILEKYPYFNKEFAQDMTVTTMSRVKGLVLDAKKWCGYLHTK